MDQARIRAEFENVAAKAEQDWGALRRFISAHPLTGFWLGGVLGAVVGCFAVWVF